MGNEVETTSATPSPDNQNLTTVTLALTPRQVDLLASADLNTTLRLALRPPKESIRAFPAEPLKLGVAERTTNVQIVPQAPAPAAPAAAPPAPAAPVVAAAKPRTAAPAPNAVQVIELDRIEGSAPHR
jgi:Flp pilus assembly protein CpaB